MKNLKQKKMNPKKSPEQGLFRFAEDKMDAITDHVRRIISETMCDDIYLIVGDNAEEQCCARFAACEIINILYRTELPPLVVLESFRDRMVEYSKLNTKAAYIFDSGRKVAEYIVNILI